MTIYCRWHLVRSSGTAFSILCGSIFFLMSCTKPREFAASEGLRRLESELIIAGKTTKVTDTKLTTFVVDRGIRRQDVCMEVYHVVRGSASSSVCFVQFTGDYGHSKKWPVAEVEVGKNILAFLNWQDGIWRPSVDFARVWIELLCNGTCKDSLSERSAGGQIAELLLRGVVSRDYPNVSSNLNIHVAHALRLASEDDVKRALHRLLQSDSIELRRSACKQLEVLSNPSACDVR